MADPITTRMCLECYCVFAEDGPCPSCRSDRSQVDVFDPEGPVEEESDTPTDNPAVRRYLQNIDSPKDRAPLTYTWFRIKNGRAFHARIGTRHSFACGKKWDKRYRLKDGTAVQCKACLRILKEMKVKDA